MKRFLFLCVCVFQIQTIISQPIDINLAKKVAERFIINHNITRSIASDKTILSDDGIALCYLFTLNPHGYIAINSDRAYNPVAAYSFTSDNTGTDALNSLEGLIKKDYSFRIKNRSRLTQSFIQSNYWVWQSLLNGETPLIKDKTFQQWPDSGSTATEGWVLTKWNQSSPYNNMCPMDLGTGSRSLTGCPSTAMAQIINYYATLNGTRFIDDDDYYHNYGSNQFMIDDDFATYGFPSFPKLNTYLDTLENTYLSKVPLTTNDIAALIFACGVATKSVYSSAGSGTFGVDQAYDGFLRMGFLTAQLLDTSVSNPFPQIIANIKDSLPVFLAVVNPGWTSGHNLVIDGYNTDDFYHLNFGWGGSYDVWYSIPSGLPYSLTVFEGIIINIKPQNTAGFNNYKVSNSYVSLYPNPAIDAVQLTFPSSVTESFQFRLYNSFGQLISETPVQISSGIQSSKNISLSKIPQGIYTWKLTGSSSSFSGKLIKL